MDYCPWQFLVSLSPYHEDNLLFRSKILDMAAFKSASLIATIEQCSGWKKWCCYLGEKEGAKRRRQRLHTTEPWEQCWAALFSITTIARPCFSFHLLNTHHLRVQIDALLGSKNNKKMSSWKQWSDQNLVYCGNSSLLQLFSQINIIWYSVLYPNNKKILHISAY